MSLVLFRFGTFYGVVESWGSGTGVRVLIVRCLQPSGGDLDQDCYCEGAFAASVNVNTRCTTDSTLHGHFVSVSVYLSLPLLVFEHPSLLAHRFHT